MTAVALGWYMAKRGTLVAARYVEAKLGKPSLVRETSRLTPLELIKHPVRSRTKLFKKEEDPLKGIILSVSFQIISKMTYINLLLFIFLARLRVTTS